ncbi:MAG TPA: copper resistance protein CopC [Candidatus Limnocylindria bacterium]|nr:copper resistance protein CopC [Candidatus Limnocylindria bacterium]
MSASRRRVAALLLACVALLTIVGGAAAHAQLVASSPAPGEVLEVAPTELRLTFSEPLEAGFSSASLIDAEGAALVTRAGEVDPSDAFTLVVPLPDLADGVYSVTWQSLSTADGHPAEGFYTFGVGNVTLEGTVSGQETGGADPSDPIGLAGKWLTYVALFLGLGVAIFSAAVLRGQSRFKRRVPELLGGLLVAGGVAMLALALRIPIVEGTPIGEYLFGSRGGVLAVARTAVMVAGGGLAIGFAGRSVARALAITALTSLVGMALHVAGGHAAASGSPVPVAVQLVHLVGGATWLSGVVVLAVVGSRGALVLDGERPPLRDLIPRFSALALAGIGLVAATGLYAEWTQIGGLPTDQDAYGRALIVKLIVVAAAIGMGAINFFDGGTNRGWFGGLRPRLFAEAGLGLAVLAATALLSTTPPAATRGIALEPRPSALGQVNGAIALSISPGRPGVNQLAVDLQGTIGDLPLDLLLSHVETGTQTRISLAGAQPGSEPIDHTQHAARPPTSGVERYVAGAVVIAADSHWDANVVVGDGRGGEILRQRFTFTMGERALTDGVAGSLADGALVAGLALLLGGVLAVGLGLGGFVLPRAEIAASRLALLAGGGLAAATGLAIGVGRLVGIA